MSCINQFNLKFVYCGTVDGQHMRQEEKKKSSFRSLLEARFIHILTPQRICREIREGRTL